MGFDTTVGRYRLGRTIGEGSFAKVKLALDTSNWTCVAIKIIDKSMITERRLKYQVEKEIRAMKLLNHPNIVKIHEVIGTKTKIYIVMDYVSGGQLSDISSYEKRLDESEVRKLFQQLIDAIEYCHSKGVYHRDLKTENLLLDSKGNLKVSDFGLSALHRVIAHKGYEGAAADIWSCGVVLFELLAGYLPFQDRNLSVLCRKICRADYRFPPWFTPSQRRLISRMFDPNRWKRITIPEIIEDPWFKIGYVPSCGHEDTGSDMITALNSTGENVKERQVSKPPSFINAFKLIAMSADLDLSGLFEEKNVKRNRTRLGSKHPVQDTLKKIEAAALDVSLSAETIDNFKVKIRPKQKMTRCSRSCYHFAEVIEVTPTHCVVEISKSAGELAVYEEFYKSLSSLLSDTSEVSSNTQEVEGIDGNSKSTSETRSLDETIPNSTNVSEAIHHHEELGFVCFSWPVCTLKPVMDSRER